MQLRISPSMRSITILTSGNNGFLDSMKVKVAARHISYRTLFHTILALAFLLPFVFILTAVVTLEGVNNCSSLDCLGRHLGPRFLGRGHDDSKRLVKDFYKILNRVNSEDLPLELKLPESFSELISEMKNNQYDGRTFAIRLKAMDILRATLEPDLMVIGPKRTPHQNFRPNTYSKVIAKGGKGGKNITKSGRKITKGKRSAYCEVCKIQCDTEEVLKCHKQGKKHKANLQKLQESITAKPAAATETNSEITEAPASDKDKANAERSKRKYVPVTAEELEAKKRRVLEGGAAIDGVKICTVCNVVVNSPKVLEYHIQGQKHAAMVKQQQEQLNAPNAPEN